MVDEQRGETELAQRVTYSMLAAAARLATAFDLPLKGVGRQLQTAFFQVLRQRGLKLHDICERLDISPSLAATLSKRLKERFLPGQSPLALARRIEFMLWSEPMSRARLAQILPDEDPADVAAALDTLLSEGRIAPLGDRAERLAVSAQASRLAGDRLPSRLDALDQLMGAVSQTVFTRFFAPDRPSFARVLTLRIRPQDLPALEALYREQLWPRLSALDAAAEGDPDAQAIEVVMTWAPYLALETHEHSQKDSLK